MTLWDLKDKIKEGRPIKRESWTNYVDGFIVYSNGFIRVDSDGKERTNYVFTYDDLFANDWLLA